MSARPPARPPAFQRSLTFQLLALVVLPLIGLLLAITLGSTALHQNAMRTLVGERDEQAARTAAAALEDVLNSNASAIRGLAWQVAYARGSTDVESVLSNAGHLQASFDGGIAVVDEKGNVLAAAQGTAATWERVKPELAEAIQAAAGDGSGAALAAEPFHRSQDDSPVMLLVERAPVLALGISQAEGPLYAAGAFTTRSLAGRVLGSAAAPERHVSYYLVGPGGLLLFSSGPALVDSPLGDHPGVAEAQAGLSGARYLEAGGQNHVVAYSPVPSTGWALLIEEPWEHVVSPLLQTTQLAPLVMVPVALVSLLALWFGVRQVVQPLQALAGQAALLGRGDYQAIEQPVGGIGEIQQLQAELIHMARVVQTAQRSLHSYIGAITTGQEEERRRLARELHDETIQSLIALKHRIQLAQLDWADQPSIQALEELEGAAERIIENLRLIIRALRPIFLEDLGLIAALQMIAEEAGRASGAQVRFHHEGAERRFEPAVELALYRIVQEALRNAARHAGATTIAVEIAFSAGETVLTVADDGKGFQPPDSPAGFAAQGHFGLLGMQERAERIGARLEVQSRAGLGTRLYIRYPG
jgi:signal transduction histidine kinase